MFIFGALIMLLVWITFLPGAPLESMVCGSLRDPEYTIFKEVAIITVFQQFYILTIVMVLHTCKSVIYLP